MLRITTSPSTRRVINQLHTKHSVRSVTSPPHRHVEGALLRRVDLIEALDDRVVHVLVLVNRVTTQIHKRVITTTRPLRTPGARSHIRVGVTEQGHHTVIRLVMDRRYRSRCHRIRRRRNKRRSRHTDFIDVIHIIPGVTSQVRHHN